MWAGRRTGKGKRSTRPGRENQADPVERSSSRNRYGPDPRISIQALRPVNRRNREAGHTTAPDRMHQAVRKMLASTGASTHGIIAPPAPKNRSQRRTVHLPVDDHPRAIGQRDLHPSRRQSIARDGIRQGRPCPGRLHNHRHQATGPASLLAKLTPPGEHQVGVHVVAPRHNRHRNPGLVALRYNPTLLGIAPTTTRSNRACPPGPQILQCFRHLRSCPLGPWWTPPWCHFRSHNLARSH